MGIAPGNGTHIHSQQVKLPFWPEYSYPKSQALTCAPLLLHQQQQQQRQLAALLHFLKNYECYRVIHFVSNAKNPLMWAFLAPFGDDMGMYVVMMTFVYFRR